MAIGITAILKWEISSTLNFELNEEITLELSTIILRESYKFCSVFTCKKNYI